MFNPDPALRSKMQEAVRLHQAGHHRQAEKLYRDILENHPDFNDARHFLGLLAYQTGRTKTGIELMTTSLRFAPQNPGYLGNLGGALLADGQSEAAINCFRRATEITPQYAESWHHLAVALRQTGQLEEAADCWRTALKCDPHHNQARALLAETLLILGWVQEALAAYSEALALQPDNPALYAGYAACLADSGQPWQALQTLDKGEKLVPHTPDPAIFHQRGIIQAQLGRFDEARAALAKAIELKPDLYHAYLDMAVLKNTPLDAPLTARLLKAANQADQLPEHEAVYLHFALAAILDDNARYEQAMTHYRMGNDLHRKSSNYSSQSQLDYFNAIKRCFDSEFIQRDIGFRTRTPVFIVGMPRSGTTLLEQLLARHPQVFGAGELTILHDQLRRQFNARRDYEKMFAGIRNMQNGQLLELASRVAEKMQALAPEKTFILDKMPSNFMYLGLLHVLFPSAPIIHCVRDPLDTCLSCYTTCFKRGHEFSYNLVELGEFYGMYADLMRYWENLLPEQRILRVSYETLVNDPETELRRILEYCGITWDEQILRQAGTTTQIRSASVFQARQPITTGSSGRSRHYRQWLEPLISALDSSIPLA